MPVGVVARQVAVVYPEYAFRVEFTFQSLFYLFFAKRLVAMRCQQTARSGEHRALAVALNRTTFEHEVETVHIFAFQFSFVIKSAIDGVV